MYKIKLLLYSKLLFHKNQITDKMGLLCGRNIILFNLILFASKTPRKISKQSKYGKEKSSTEK